MGRLRTFIGIELERSVRARCVALQETLARAGDVKWVEPDNLHVTLLFLGEVDERQVPEVCRAVGTACAGIDAFPMSVEGVGSFGNPRALRTVWAGVGTGSAALIELHEALEATLLELGCYRREDRAFTPHITLGRVKSQRPADRLAEELQRQLGWHAGEAEVREVVVMSSELRPEGPVYTVLSRGKLRRAGGPG